MGCRSILEAYYGNGHDLLEQCSSRRGNITGQLTRGVVSVIGRGANRSIVTDGVVATWDPRERRSGVRSAQQRRRGFPFELLKFESSRVTLPGHLDVSFCTY
jgi:hypothetical protein